MSRILLTLALLGGGALTWVGTSHGVSAAERAPHPGDTAAQSVNPVVEWNRTLLMIVRTPIVS